MLYAFSAWVFPWGLIFSQQPQVSESQPCLPWTCTWVQVDAWKKLGQYRLTLKGKPSTMQRVCPIYSYLWLASCTGAWSCTSARVPNTIKSSDSTFAGGSSPEASDSELAWLSTWVTLDWLLRFFALTCSHMLHKWGSYVCGKMLYRRHQNQII